MTRREEMRQRAAAFHDAHPEVWRSFVRFAMHGLRDGRLHYSGKAIMEDVRHETTAGDSAPALKINDHVTSFYTRRFARIYPEHAAFFRCRVQRSGDRPAMGTAEPTRDHFTLEG